MGKWKYLIFKILGFALLFATPLIYSSYYDAYLAEESFYYMNIQWLYTCEFLMVAALLLIAAGFARSIAKVLAFIDFHTDFDDDQELEDYPRIQRYSIIKRIVMLASLAIALVLSVVSGYVPAVADVIADIWVVVAVIILAMAIVNIIVCLCAQVTPLYFDISTLFFVISVWLFFAMISWGVLPVVISIVTSLPCAIAVLYAAIASEEFISAEEIFDKLFYEDYKAYYAKLCEKEKAAEAKANMDKRLARKQVRKNAKAEEKTQKIKNKAQKKAKKQ